jgi:hypothetical protein
MYKRQEADKGSVIVLRALKPFSLGKLKWMTAFIGAYIAVFFMCANIANDN